MEDNKNIEKSADMPEFVYRDGMTADRICRVAVRCKSAIPSKSNKGIGSCKHIIT